jgi:hypothetical protein
VTSVALELEPTPQFGGPLDVEPSNGQSEMQTATEKRQREVRESVGALHAFVDLVDHVRRERVRGIGLLAILNVADVATTAVFLRLGAAEGNPALAPVAGHWWFLLLIKGIIIAVVAKFVLAAPARSALARRMVTAAIVYYAAVVAWNLVTIIRL